MSKRWRRIAVVVALGVFLYTFVYPDVNPIGALAGYPPIVGAIAWAIFAIIWVWFLESIVDAIRRSW